MKVNRSLKNFISFAIFCLILSLCISGLSKILMRKECQDRYGEFFEDTRDFDVLIFGNSHINDAIYPMEIWNEYGITSYNCAYGGNRIPTTYWIIRNYLDIHTPKVIILDVYGLDSDELIRPDRDGIGYLHSQTDLLPFSLNKLRIGRGLFEENPKIMLELVFPISLYHSRWDDLTGADFGHGEQTYFKGAWLPTNYSRPTKSFSLVPETETLPIEDIELAYYYLKAIIQECEEHNVNLVLTQIPFPGKEEDQKYANSINNLANEYNIPYLNMMYTENLIDYKTDCYDPNSHLNYSGGLRVSSYIGQYLIDNYNICSHKDDPVYVDWDEEYEDFNEYKHLSLSGLHGSLYSYLVLLRDPSVNITAYVNGNSPIAYDDIFIDLMKNIGATDEIYDIRFDDVIYSFECNRTTSTITEGINNQELCEETFTQVINFYRKNELEIVGGSKELSYDSIEYAFIITSAETGEIIDALYH